MLNFFILHTPLFYLTQSLWRDEVFSILLAKTPILSFIGKLTFEPPLYYILLHFWMKLFGTGEIAARGLSLFAFALATIVVIHWAELLFKKHWLYWYLPVFFFFNPTLLYYAFEVRMYGWYILFATASMYAYMEKKWKLLALVTTLGFYTHTYMIFIPFVQCVHYVLTHFKQVRLKHIRSIFANRFVRSLLTVGVCISPWIVKIILDIPRLKQSWYYPVDFHLVMSVLGNVFVGYEGTPWFLWSATAGVSLLLIALFALSLKKKATRLRNGFFILLIFIPLTIIIGVSFIKPLFVNRYVIFVTIAEVFAVVFALEAIRHKAVQMAAAGLLLIAVILFDCWYPLQHKKLDIRNTLRQVNALQGKNDVVLVDSPLVFFESIYYSKTPAHVYFYDPQGLPFPWYVGDTVVSPSQIVYDLPPYPIRAFIVHQNGTFDIGYNAAMTNPPKQKIKK